MADYIGKGKYVLVDFWAYWRGPCIREAKETLLPLYEIYKDNPDFMILGVMTSDEPENHLAAYKGFNYLWTQMIDTTTPQEKYRALMQFHTSFFLHLMRLLLEVSETIVLNQVSKKLSNNAATGIWYIN